MQPHGGLAVLPWMDGQCHNRVLCSGGIAISAEGDADAVAVATFAFELGVLKRMRRAGWWHAGVRDPESVAEHSLRTAQLASMIASLEGADAGRAAFLAVWHDVQETRTGDIPLTAQPYLADPNAGQIAADQTKQLPERLPGMIQAAAEEFGEGQTLESRCAHDADKLECLIQAIEYRDSGYVGVQGWIDSCKAALTTQSALRIAAAALETSIVAWRGR
jgi:putative hydrolases of HD superfamily